MEFEQTEKSLTTEELANFEAEINAILPDDFKRHYLEHNGGYPPYEQVKGIDKLFTINGFIPVKYGSVPIEQTIADYKKSGITFEQKVPFAFDNGGNIYLISVDKDDFGGVYLIESEFLDEKNYYKVSNNFTEFIDSFYE